MFKKEKTVIITGGSSGIGAETAKHLSQYFKDIYIIDNKSPNFELNNINFIQVDITNFDVFSSIIQKISENGPIGYLFTNAGIIEFGSITETSTELINKIISTNLLGTIYSLKLCLPYMMQNKFGKIVLMGSDQSLVGKKGMSIYGATKGAIAQLTKSTALDYAKYNINVNCICPGTIETENYTNLINLKSKELKLDPEQLRERSLKLIPLQRNGTTSDVAYLVEYLFSEKSSFLTGSIIPIDGGYTAQ